MISVCIYKYYVAVEFTFSNIYVCKLIYIIMVINCLEGNTEI